MKINEYERCHFMDFQCHVQNFKWEAQHGSLKESDTLLTIQGKLKEAVTVWKDPVEFLIKLCEDVKKKKRRRNSQQSLTGKYKKMRITWK